jgi:hypothetical protein
VWDETLTIEYASETLAQYHATVAADGRALTKVADPRLYATGHASPQPFLPVLADLDWYPAQRLLPYRPRRPRRNPGTQVPLPVMARDAQIG